MRNIFDRGVYVGKNTSQAASVEFVRHIGDPIKQDCALWGEEKTEHR